jgi:hypothetical protein
MDEIRPHCKHYSDNILLMSEAAQQDEWLGELKQRAENFMITQGSIPHDHFQTMRMHPQFKTQLVPHIQGLFDTISRIGAKDYSGKIVGPENHAAVMLTLGGTLALEAPKAAEA